MRRWSRRPWSAPERSGCQWPGRRSQRWLVSLELQSYGRHIEGRETYEKHRTKSERLSEGHSSDRCRGSLRRIGVRRPHAPAIGKCAAGFHNQDRQDKLPGLHRELRRAGTRQGRTGDQTGRQSRVPDEPWRDVRQGPLWDPSPVSSQSQQVSDAACGCSWREQVEAHFVG